MAYELTKKLNSIDPYIRLDEKCDIRLDSNESCFNVTERLGDVISEAVKGIQFNRYPDILATEVTKAFADYYGIDPILCTAGNGSDELISLILGSYLEKGDTVLTLSPDFSMYAFYGALSELKVKTLPKEEDFRISIAKVIDCCNNNDVKALIFSNPCNPTSLGVTRQDMIKLLKNIFCLVIVDEAYMDFWGESILDLVTEYDNLIVLKTCSKNMGLAALRLGFAVSSLQISQAMKAVKSPYNINSVTQAAACAVLRSKDVIREYTEKIIESRKALQEALSDMAKRCFAIEKVYNSVTNFVLVKVTDPERITAELLEKSISVRRLGSYIRVTAGTEEENRIFLEEFEKILIKVRKEKGKD